MFSLETSYHSKNNNLNVIHRKQSNCLTNVNSVDSTEDLSNMNPNVKAWSDNDGATMKPNKAFNKINDENISAPDVNCDN